MKFTPFLTLLLALLAAALPAPVKGSPLYFKTVGLDQGLPDNSVNAVAEDCFGSIWLATWNGLARFDGHEIATYRHSVEDPASLSNDIVRALLPVRGGIYVGTDHGLDFLDFTSGKFFHAVVGNGDGTEPDILTRRVSRLLRTGGQIFAVTVDGDLLRLRREQDGSHMLVRLPRPKDRRYADIAKYSGGRLIALSDRGISMLDNSGERILSHTTLVQPFDPNLNVQCDTVSGYVYVGGGIGRRSSVFKVVDPRRSFIPVSDVAVPDNMMACVVFPDGRTAFATDGEGLWIASPEGETQVLTPDNSNLSGDVIYSLCRDTRGNLWCGTYRRGLSLLSPQLNSYSVFDRTNGMLSHQIVTGSCKIGNRIYIALDGGGLDIYDTVSGHTLHRTSRNSGLPGNNITGIVYDGSRLWMTVYSHGLVEYDPATDTFTTHPVGEDVEPGSKLWTLSTGDDNHIVVGGLRLHSYDKRTGRFSEIFPGQDMGVTGISGNGDNLWVSTRRNGLMMIDRQSYELRAHYRPDRDVDGVVIPGKDVECAYEDSDRRIWLSVADMGMYYIEPGKGGKVVPAGPDDGLLDARVKSITEDPDGNLWLGTVNGLYKYLRVRGRFVKVSDSRLPKEYTVNSAGFSDGNIWLGTTSGLVAIPFSTNVDPTAALSTLFSAIDIFSTEGRHIALYGSEAERVRLGAKENFFTFTFSVPEMVNPDLIQMECCLEGFDRSWRNISESRSASYTNVPPGHYNMKVRHAGPDGVWTDPVQLDLDVLPPWYLSWWAITLWCILLIGIVTAAILLRRRYIHNCNLAREAEREHVEAKKLSDAKIDFLAGISHELRTPCFLISAQIEELLEQPGGKVSINSLKGIYRNSQKLNKLISNIIDFRKMETGNLILRPRSMDVGELLEELSHDYENLCRQKDLTFTYVPPAEPVVAMVDPDKIEFIVTNLMTNAYKYTPRDGGGVTLSLDLTADDIVIRVADTGIGIEKEQQTAIFRPFYRAEKGLSDNYGDGIGLAFVKQMVDLHNGSIGVESEVNKGTTFTVTIPRGNVEEQAPVEEEEAGAERSMAVETEQPDVEHYVIDNPTAVHSILIVDDEEELRQVLTNAFGPEYNVVAVASVDEARQRLKTKSFDVMITDLMLPDEDGHGLIKSLRADLRNADMRIIVLSALSSDEEMLQAYEEGADLYVTKPISLKMLRHHVEHLKSGRDSLTPLPAAAGRDRKYTQDDRRFLIRCRAIIDEHLLDDSFSISVFAGKLAMSHSALYKKIKSLTGLSVIEFINEYKISKAVTLFRQGATNVQMVADQCGFRDIKTFREIFKRKMHMPPKQYVQSLSRGGYVEKDESVAEPQVSGK